MNAKTELQEILEKKAKVKCAQIIKGCEYYDDNKPCLQFDLKINHTEDDFLDFLNRLDFNYDSGFGKQELFGTVWLEDGTWLSRNEYDGTEWWEHNIQPNIPIKLL